MATSGILLPWNKALSWRGSPRDEGPATSQAGALGATPAEGPLHPTRKEAGFLPAVLAEGINEVTSIQAENKCGYYFKAIP